MFTAGNLCRVLLEHVDLELCCMLNVGLNSDSFDQPRYIVHIWVMVSLMLQPSPTDDSIDISDEEEIPNREISAASIR